MSRRWAAELVGTFALVFAGTGAIVIDRVSGGYVTHVGVALTFGLVVLAMILALGDVSGAHMNPAVTIAFAAARRFAWSDVGGYVAAQVAGAMLASGLLRWMFSGEAHLGATVPSGGALQSFALELVLTWILVLVVLCVSAGAKERGIIAAAAIGSVVALEALFAGPISGASMNPARSLAPGLWTGELGALWIYLAAPTAGALLAVPTCRALRPVGCCGAGISADCMP